MSPKEMQGVVHLTTGEIIVIVLSIVLLIVGLQTFLGYCIIEWAKRRYGKETRDIVRQGEKWEILNFAIEALQRFNSIMQTQCAVQVAILERVAEKADVFEELPKLSEENRRLKDKVRRCLQEAFLGSHIERRRFAAAQELADSVGDANSLERMRYAAKFFPNDRNLALSIEHLEERLHARDDN